VAAIFGRDIRHFIMGVFGALARWPASHSHVEKYGFACWRHGTMLATINDVVVAYVGLCAKLCAIGTARG
jgi:hypothetical protein